MKYGFTFLGYRRARGRPGVRNHLLVLNLTGLTAPAARHIAAALEGALLVSMPHGTAITGRGEGPAERTLLQLARHPNAGAVLLLSADRARSTRAEAALGDAGKPVESLVLDEVGRDILGFRDAAVRRGARLLAAISRQRREPFAWSELMLALECGLSDPTSGLAANPLVGRVVDRLVAAGGAAVFGETTEWLGCEDQLAERAADARTARSIRNAVARREEAARRSGLDLLGNNPNQANIRAGLTTIEDKAVGSVSKSGTGPIGGFLDYGEAAEGAGLYAMDGASYTPESLTGLVAAGAQLALFTSGLGNSYVSALAPTVKITANRATAERLVEQFDFACPELLDGAPVHGPAERLVGRILEVASGALTLGEILGEGDEVISRFGEAL